LRAKRSSLKGKAIKLGNNISTDEIIPGRFAHLRSNLPELAKHILEDADPRFITKVRALSLRAEGEAILVVGKNFGLGSSREHAPIVIKMSGISAILARSVARIFFRNAINQGMPVLLCDTDKIADGDKLEINLSDGLITNLTSRPLPNKVGSGEGLLSSGARLRSSKTPSFMLAILEEGGLIPYIRKHKDFIIRCSSEPY